MKQDRRLLHISALLIVAAVAWQFGIKFGVIALAVALLGIRGSAGWKKGADGKYRHPNEQILYNKFGRWTPVLQYGPLALFAVVSVAARQTGNRDLTRLSLILLLVFFAVGLYLCWVIASEKHGWNEPDKDDGEEE